MSPTTPDPAPQIDLAGLAGSILHTVWAALAQAVTTSPILGVLLIAVVLAGGVRSARRAMYAGWERDPVRLFTRADKAAILRRAGSRCEHHVVVFGRCRTTERLQADHIHPWSRGGHTKLANGQALCERHNREKRATVPFNRQLRRIEQRRSGYFPAGESVAVARRSVTLSPEVAAGRRIRG